MGTIHPVTSEKMQKIYGGECQNYNSSATNFSWSGIDLKDFKSWDQYKNGNYNYSYNYSTSNNNGIVTSHTNLTPDDTH